MARIRDIARILGRSENTNTNNSEYITVAPFDSAEVTTFLQSEAAPIVKYDSIGALPTTGLTSGDRALVENSDSNSARFYISNGYGWYNMALVNLSPSIDSIDGYVSALDSGDSLTMSMIVSDSDDVVISYGATISPSNATDSGITTFSRDSSVVSLAVGAGDLANFDITFTANDTINTATLTKSFTISRLSSYVSPDYIAANGFGTAITNTNNAYSYNSGTKTWTKNTYSASFELVLVEIDMTDYSGMAEWYIQFEGAGFGNTFSDRSYHRLHGKNSTHDATVGTGSSYYAQNRSDTGGWEYGSGVTGLTALAGSYTSLAQLVHYVKATGTWTHYMKRNRTGSWTQVYSHTVFGAGNALDAVRIDALKRTGTGLTMFPVTPTP
jgi:hypothetical protein